MTFDWRILREPTPMSLAGSRRSRTTRFSGLPGRPWRLPAAPQPVLGKLESEMVRILSQPQLRERWAGEGTVIAPSGAEKLGALVKTERARWADVIKRAGVKPE